MMTNSAITAFSHRGEEKYMLKLNKGILNELK